MGRSRRIRDQAGRDFEAALLRAGRDHGASEAARARTLAALGLGSAASAAGVAAAAGTVAKTALTARVVIGAVLLSGVFAGGGAVVYLARHSASDAPPLSRTSGPAPIAHQPLATEARPRLPDTSQGDALDVSSVRKPPAVAAKQRTTRWRARRRSAPSRQVARRARQVGAAPNAAGGGLIAPSASPHARSAWGRAQGDDGHGPADEIRVLDRARAALRAGQPARALALLAPFVTGRRPAVLADEMTVTRIEALLRLGDRARARSLAEQFLRDQPSSVHARRLRSLVADDSSPASGR